MMKRSLLARQRKSQKPVGGAGLSNGSSSSLGGRLLAAGRPLSSGGTTKKGLLASMDTGTAVSWLVLFAVFVYTYPTLSQVQWSSLWGGDGIQTYSIYSDPLLGYESQEEMDARSQRFPSVDLRVRVYMSAWYLPPCEDSTGAYTRFRYLANFEGDKLPSLYLQEVAAQTTYGDNAGVVMPRRVVKLDGEVIAYGSYFFYMDPMHIAYCDTDFCVDTKRYMFPALERLYNSSDSKNSKDNNIPILMQFGDAEATKAFIPADNFGRYYPRLPVIKKFRHAFPRKTLEEITTVGNSPSSTQCVMGVRNMYPNPTHIDRIEPIVWKLTYLRHFGMLEEIPDNDIPWEEKRNMAVFRAGLTGIKKSGLSIAELAQLTDRERCQLMTRCRLVFNMASESHMVDAKLVGNVKLIKRIVDGVQLFGEKMDYHEQLKFKAIIMLEGNDISSGFKWALFSNSVVMTTIPKLTSWALEELLEPWVHYIPIKDDMSDVKERMQWVLDNDQAAKRIAHQGSLWIRDLIFHPQAMADDDAIFRDMLERYRAQFMHDPSLVIPIPQTAT